MSSGTLPRHGPAAHGAEPEIDLGVIGQRQLICVQMFDIARHPSNPVAVIPGTFIAVTGKGPRDSNESGKTSWEAGLSFLLGDPEWKVYGAGAASVALLLFEPDTAGSAAADFPAAIVGYIAAVFADPEDVAGSAHTVWVRISAKAPYVRVRHAAGVHLVEVDDESARHELAQQVFAGLPGPDLGAAQFAERLYGPVPRCLAYLSARGKQRGGPSLLKLDTGQFTEGGIGSALITLTGRAGLLDKDQALRKDLSEHLLRLIGLREQDAEAEERDAQHLRSIERRDRARALLADAQRVWALHYARGLLDVLDRKDRLDWELASAVETIAGLERKAVDVQRQLLALEDLGVLRHDCERAAAQAADAEDRAAAAQQQQGRLSAQVETLRHNMADAQARAAGVKGDLTEARALFDQARRAAAAAAAQVAGSEAAVQAARSEVESAERGEHGAAGQAVRSLAAKKIHAVGLLDALDVPDALRPEWEARLSLYRDAVCVRQRDVMRALKELADQPGAVVLACPPARGAGAFDAGDGFDAPADLHAFLTSLAARMSVSSNPLSALDDAVGVHVLGGFAEPQTGRRALTDRLARALEEARAGLSAATAQQASADTVEQQCGELVERLEQAEAAIALERGLSRAERTLAGHLDVLKGLRRSQPEAQAAASAANVLLKTAEVRQTSLRGEGGRVREALARARAAHADLGRQISALDLDYWIERAHGPKAARQALGRPAESDGQPDGATAPGERRTESSLRQNAGRQLDQALSALGIDASTGEGSPLEELADAIRLRANEGDSAGNRRFADATAFETPADVLGDWLTGYAERDRDAAAAIESARAERARNIAFEQGGVDELQVSLTNQQVSIKDRLDQALHAIEDALNMLNERARLYGAELRRTIIPPATLEDLWQCEVTPCWRRTPNGPMLPYNNITNSAQEKLFSIHLVLAALLASPCPRGRVLILDELGDSLGFHHRREVLTAISEIAKEYGITVLGTCQESLMDDAADYCGEILFFEYPSHTEALNLPARMFGYDENGHRVELTYDAIMAGRNWW